MADDSPCEFELLIEKLGLVYEHEVSKSPAALEWIKRNAHRRFVPEWILRELHIEIPEDEVNVCP